MAGKESDKKSTAPNQANPPGKKDAPKETKEQKTDTKNDKQAQSNGAERPHTRASVDESVEKLKKHAKNIEEDSIIKEKVIDPEEEKRKEAEKFLQQRFKTFEIHFKELCNLLDAWDRTQGTVFRQPSPSEKSDPDDLPKKMKIPKSNFYIYHLKK